ncbi:MAG: hypothetical protein FWH52_04380 [Synergistaceae bacterium]|nr:hypothetical protein [Synergistaceae bacterium]
MMKNKTQVIILIVVIALIALSAAFFFVVQKTKPTTEESVSYPNAVIAIIMDLRNMRAAAQIYRNDNLEKLDTIKPELKNLVNYLENPSRFTKTEGEYLFTEANGEWWVGYNLAAAENLSDDIESVHERLLYMAGNSINGSMDINIPYNREDIIYMPVR